MSVADIEGGGVSVDLLGIVGAYARDLSISTELGYHLVEAIPVDYFPQTAHVETVVLMSRVKE